MLAWSGLAFAGAEEVIQVCVELELHIVAAGEALSPQVEIGARDLVVPSPLEDEIGGVVARARRYGSAGGAARAPVS